MGKTSRFVVSADWLQQRLGTPGLKVVDASWYLPPQGRNGRAEYDAGHIPGSVYFDQDQVVDPEATLPHTLAPAPLFARYAGSMGIAADDTIVVHDGPGFFSAPRVWWLFRVMGAKEVYVLEGGIDGWKRDGRPVTGEPTKIAGNLFDVDFDASRVASFEAMRKIVETGSAQVADARPAGRFTGADAEPRAGMRSGHMPGARNVPAASLSADGKLLPLDELRAKLEDAGIDLDGPVVTSCGSGVTAAVITLALESLGHTDNRLYDGSWSEWGGRADTPVVTGPAEPKG